MMSTKANHLFFALILICGASLFIVGCQTAKMPFTKTSPNQAYLAHSSNQLKLIQALKKQGVQVIAIGDQLRIVIATDRFFEPQSANANPDLKSVIADAAALIKTHQARAIQVLGYTDNVGSVRAQYQLSQQLAQTVASYLWNQGIPLYNMEIMGKGSQAPIASNATAGGSAANRRVEILVAS